jgi:hypothetical protein
MKTSLTTATAAVLTVLALAACGAPTTEAPGQDPTTAAQSEAPAAQETPAEAPATPAMTKSQEQALGAAQSYVDTMPFSKAGLVAQLTSEFDGFSKADAAFAVKYVKADWKAEAVEAAQSYLDSGMSFSRKALIAQMTSKYGSQFTKAEATYAADKVGL